MSKSHTRNTNRCEMWEMFHRIRRKRFQPSLQSRRENAANCLLVRRKQRKWNKMAADSFIDSVA